MSSAARTVQRSCRSCAEESDAGPDLDHQDRQPGTGGVPVTMLPVHGYRGKHGFCYHVPVKSLLLWFFSTSEGILEASFLTASAQNMLQNLVHGSGKEVAALAGLSRVCSPSHGLTASDSTACQPRICQFRPGGFINKKRSTNDAC